MSGACGRRELLNALRERYEQLNSREKQVFDVVLDTVRRNVKGLPLHELSAARSAEMREYIEYGQALLAVYRLVKRGIVPDPKIVTYLKDNLNPELAKQLALSHQSAPSPSSGNSDNTNKPWTRATLAQKLLRDSTNKYSRLVSVPAMDSAGQQVNHAVRLENLKTLQQVLARKYLKLSLRSPEQIYNFIVSNDAVGTLSAVAGPSAAAAATNFLDKKEEVLVKLGALMSDQGHKLLPNRVMVPPLPKNNSVRVPIFTALTNFRRHKFPPGRLRLAKTISLKDDMVDTGKHWLEQRNQKRSAYSNIARQASHRISNIELKRQQESEREQRERMKALRERNMEAYMALVKNVKNQRIQEILENTEKLLQDIGAKIQMERVQNEEKRRMEAEKAAEKARKREERRVARAKARAAAKGMTVEEAEAAAPATETAEAEAKEAVEDDEEEEEEATKEKPSYLSLSHKTSELVEQPKCLVGGRLMTYQMAGLDFLVSLYNNNLSGILADEMGLGKTIQTISLIAYLYEIKNIPGPHLIAVPLSTLPNWSSEFNKWCPALKVLEYRGSKNDRRELNYEVKKCRYNVLLTTFEYILREKRVLGGVKWRFIIVDEGHKMKNVKSKFHSTLGEFKSTHRLLLTGTPLQNNLNELWSLLNFLMPHTFSSGEDFERWFEEPFKETGIASGGGGGGGGGPSEISLSEEEKLVVINRLHLVLRPFLLRRVKSDVLTDLPSKKEHIVHVPLSKWQEMLYDQIVNKCYSSTSRLAINNTIMQLRKVVNHPYLFLDMYNIDEMMIHVSGKLELLDRMLTKLLATNDHKILIFNQMTCMMDIICDYMEYRQFEYFRLDGTMILSDRQERMAAFNDPESDVRIFILSTRAGGLGLNLQSADVVILFDSDWNPHADLQAQSRAHRLGQKKNVSVYRFITQSPIEQLILNKAQYKLSIDQQIIQAGMFNNETVDEADRQNYLKNILTKKADNSAENILTSPPTLCDMMAGNDHEQTLYRQMDTELFGGPEIYNLFFAEEEEIEEDEDPPSASADLPPTATTIGGQSLPSYIHKNQSIKDNERIKEILELSGRLCKESDIPLELRNPVIPTEGEIEENDDSTRTVRKSRLRAQQLLTARQSGTQDEEDDDEKQPRSAQDLPANDVAAEEEEAPPPTTNRRRRNGKARKEETSDAVPSKRGGGEGGGRISKKRKLG